MSDYISREELMKVLKPFVIRKGVMENINAIPSADVRENIHGTWEEWKIDKYEGVPICSVCKHGFPLGFHQYNLRGFDSALPKFCPNCGADMRGEAE